MFAQGRDFSLCILKMMIYLSERGNKTDAAIDIMQLADNFMFLNLYQGHLSRIFFYIPLCRTEIFGVENFENHPFAQKLYRKHDPKYEFLLFHP